MPVLAYSGTNKVSGQQGYSGKETTPESLQVAEPDKPEVQTGKENRQDVSTRENNEQKVETENPEQTTQPEQKSTSPVKPSATEKQIKEYYKTPSQSKRFAFSASSNFSGRGKVEGPSNSMIKAVASQVYEIHSAAPQVQQISETTYSLPLNFGIGVTYKVNDLLTVGTGVSYSYLHSKYNGLINGQFYNIKQGVHYVGVPVNLYFNLGSTGSVDFYAAAGGAVEKGVKVTYQMKSASGSGKTSDSHVKGVQFSTKAVGGIEYRFGKSKSIGLYLEPGVTYYFDSDLPASIRTDQPLQFEAQAGIRFHLK